MMRSSIIRASDLHEQGFTLIEVIMALSVFALIAGLSYAALGVAGSGFETLVDVRKSQQSSGWVARQLGSDMRYLSAAPHRYAVGQGQQQRTENPAPLRIKNDNRGDVEFDDLWLLVHEPGSNGTTQVHYYIDQDRGHLMRQSRLLVARKLIKPIVWDFGKAGSWGVEVLDLQGNWRQDWNFHGAAFQWPRAVRVRMQGADGEHFGAQHEWWFPVLIGKEL